MRTLLCLLTIAGVVNGASILPKAPEPKLEPIPQLLYPHGQSLFDTTFLIGLSYLGGVAGQIERRVATSGVISPRTTSQPTQGNIISAPSQWMSGFEFEFSASTPGLGSNSFGLSYSMLTGSPNATTTTSGTPTDPNILPSFATSNSTGETELVLSVTSQYTLSLFQDGLFTYSRSLFANPYLSVMVLTGFHGFSLNHKMNVSYEDIATGITSLYMNEATYGAGPLVGFSSSKKISSSFVLRGIAFISAPLCNHTLTQSDQYLIGGTPFYGYNTGSTNQLRQHFVAHLDLEAVFQAPLIGGSSLEFILAWHVKQYVNQSYLTAMSNNQNAPPSTVEVDTLKAGITFIF